MKKRKLRLCWSCSDFVHHEHRYKITAWICSQTQRLWKWLKEEDKAVTKYMSQFILNR